MQIESEYSSAEDMSPEADGVQLEKVVKEFEAGIDSVLSGAEETAVLFEGDFILARKNQNLQIDIGNALSADAPLIFVKFMRSISKKGNIVSTTHEKDKQFIEGQTNASLYFRAKFPNVEFPIDRAIYLVTTNSGSGLTIYTERFYFADANKTPLMERWVAESNQLVNLYDSPAGDRKKVPVLT